MHFYILTVNWWIKYFKVIAEETITHENKEEEIATEIINGAISGKHENLISQYIINISTLSIHKIIINNIIEIEYSACIKYCKQEIIRRKGDFNHNELIRLINLMNVTELKEKIINIIGEWYQIHKIDNLQNYLL